MANQLKNHAEGIALQITLPAREAGLVEEDSDNEPTRRAETMVYSVNDLMLVLDTKQVSMAERTELVGSAIDDTGTLHRGWPARVTISGRGYLIQLPGAKDAGFQIGDRAPVVSRQGTLFVHDGTQRRLIEALTTIREDQLSR